MQIMMFGGFVCLKLDISFTVNVNNLHICRRNTQATFTL